MTLAEALWGWRFPSVSGDSSRDFMSAMASAMMALTLVLRRRSLASSSAFFCFTHSDKSGGRVMVMRV